MLKDVTILLGLATALATASTLNNCQSQVPSSHVTITGTEATSSKELYKHEECHLSFEMFEFETISRPVKSSFENNVGDCQLKSQIKLAYSSVWCKSSAVSGLRCSFQNLFFNAKNKEFVFIFSPKSIIYGIENLRDLEELYLSSVNGHNAFEIKLSVMPWKAVIRGHEVKVIKGKTLILGRFKPDNILHVFHDDLLPLFFTMRELCLDRRLCLGSLNVILTDENEKGKHWSFYQMFSSEIRTLSELVPDESEWYGFSEAHIGLNKMSVWYQYGFGIPQGPVTNSVFSGEQLREFASFIREKLNVKQTSKMQNGVLLSRRANRKLINEDDLSDAIQDVLSSTIHKEFKMKVLTLEENDIHSLITALSEALLMVGVHGSALILGMFLPPGSVLVEIWPYGVDPSAAKVYRTMCELNSFGVIYVPWVNEDFHNTLYHPEYPQHYGGLTHLPKQEWQGIIDRLDKNKLHSLECCDSTDWLFRIYQDTKVDVHYGTGHKSDSILDLILDGLKRAKSVDSSIIETRRKNLKSQLYPGKVIFLQCHLEKLANFIKLYVEWLQPWNVKHLECLDLKYEIILQINGKDEFLRYEIQEYTFLKKLDIHVESIDLWVTCFCDGAEGSASFIACY